MPRWFLSYNSQDLALMERLEGALRRKDPEAKIFFAPKSLRAGSYWLPELAKGIAEATAFVLLVGAKGLGPWQIMEYYEALDRRVKQRDFPVVLVLLDGEPAPGLPFLRQLHWIITADPASEKSIAQVMDAAAGGGALPGELWRHTAPYRGLAAMTEADSDFFFGRGRETVEIIKALEATPDKLPVLLGNSGVGKSSLAQAGVLAAFARQAWPETAEAPGAWPMAFHDSRGWCVLTLKPGGEPVRALVEPFLWTWQFDSVDPRRAELLSSWGQRLLDGRVGLRDLLDATQARYRDELHQPEPPAFLLYIDQGEELYVRAEPRQRRRFSEIVAQAVPDARLRAMMSLRADFFGDLQKDEPLFATHRQINVPPLREAQLREVVGRPAELLSARFETPGLVDIITRRAAEDSVKDVGALPLLSYTLDDMWTQMVRQGDGTLRLPAQSFELGGVLVNRANSFLAGHPGSEAQLRRIFTLRCATVREDGEATRRRAPREEFSDEEWRLVSELADYPNRLLVTVTTETGDTNAEVAHEAIFRRWDKLRDWVAQEREFLSWRSEVEAACRRWQNAPRSLHDDALLTGLALSCAQVWLGKRPEETLGVERRFIDLSVAAQARRKKDQDRLLKRTGQFQMLAFVLLIGLATGLAYMGWSNRTYLELRADMLQDTYWPKSLSAKAEQALQPGNTFKECAICPDMVVVPPGEFSMGSPQTERGRYENEGPQHKVSIPKAFAVSRYEITFDQWDGCASLGACNNRPGDQDWGRGTRPVINVNWQDTQQYLAWLAKVTGKQYRLLSEAEFEYAERAGSTNLYPWGDSVGRGNANCDGCGGQWDGQQTAPVGSFPPNAFGLFDMSGNVFQWCADRWHYDYDGAPGDGSAWLATPPNTTMKIVRSGSWRSRPQEMRSAARGGFAATVRDGALGFRVARTLSP